MNLGFQEILKNRLLSYFCWNSATESEENTAQIEIPETIYVGLMISTGIDSNPVELVVGSKGYTRVPVSFSQPASGIIKNNAQITFPRAIGSSWGKITHIALFDNDGQTDPLSGMLLVQALSTAEEVSEGSVFELDIGAIKINLI